MTSTVVFDTQALLAFYLGESGADKVENYLNGILEKRIRGYLNLINLSEFYYVLRRINKDVAEEKERNLRSFGVRIVSVSDNSKLWKQAAIIKADCAVSLADAFSAATALAFKGSILLTASDLEFERIKGLRFERI